MQNYRVFGSNCSNSATSLSIDETAELYGSCITDILVKVISSNAWFDIDCIAAKHLTRLCKWRCIKWGSPADKVVSVTQLQVYHNFYHLKKSALQRMQAESDTGNPRKMINSINRILSCAKVPILSNHTASDFARFFTNPSKIRRSTGNQPLPTYATFTSPELDAFAATSEVKIFNPLDVELFLPNSCRRQINFQYATARRRIHFRQSSSWRRIILELGKRRKL